MKTPILTLRMPMPLRRALEQKSAETGKPVSELIYEAVLATGIEPIHIDGDKPPPSVRIPNAFHDDYVARHGHAPTVTKRDRDYSTISTADPHFAAFRAEALRFADGQHSETTPSLRRSARGALRAIEAVQTEQSK